MQLPKHFVKEFPEDAGQPIKGSPTGFLFVDEEKVGKATIHIAMSGLYIEWGGGFLKPPTLLHIPYDHLTEFGFMDKSREAVVVQLNSQSTHLQFHAGANSAELFTGLFEHIMGARQHEATIRQTPPVETDEEGLQQMKHVASLTLTGWELERVPDGEKKAEDRVLAAQDEALDREPKILAQIAYELNALHETGLDTTSFDVQTIALRKAGYLRARGLSYLTVDVHNLKHRTD